MAFFHPRQDMRRCNDHFFWQKIGKILWWDLKLSSYKNASLSNLTAIKRGMFDECKYFEWNYLRKTNVLSQTRVHMSFLAFVNVCKCADFWLARLRSLELQFSFCFKKPPKWISSFVHFTSDINAFDHKCADNHVIDSFSFDSQSFAIALQYECCRLLFRQRKYRQKCKYASCCAKYPPQLQ